jgi:steroid delta-isomerase-like uncharacterized protein
MSAEDNKAIARQSWEEVADHRNLELADELFVPGYVHHDPGLPLQMQQSHDAYMQHLPMFYSAFPDFHLIIEDMVAERDGVATRWSFRGTHQGELMGMPGTGKKVAASGITIQRVDGGKTVEGWTLFNTLRMLQQIGVVPHRGWRERNKSGDRQTRSACLLFKV